MEHDAEDVTESPFMGTVRGKCVTQLLLLGALDSIQVHIPLLHVYICPAIFSIRVSSVHEKWQMAESVKGRMDFPNACKKCRKNTGAG